jgi:hypothetical protein
MYAYAYAQQVVFNFTPGDNIALWKKSRSFATLYLATRMQKFGVRMAPSRGLMVDENCSPVSPAKSPSISRFI